MNFKPLVAMAALGVAVSGCATVVSGTSQTIAITTPPATGAICTLTGGDGEHAQVSTPGVVTVPRSKNDLLIDCKKPGWKEATGTIPSHFAGATLGNVLIGGVVGVGIDAASGAANHYSRAFRVPMTKDDKQPKQAKSPAMPAAGDGAGT
jgi:hypothetical protein